MNFAIHIPPWLLWMAAGFIIGWIACYVCQLLAFGSAMGSHFGW